ncbi:response regulator [Candidatus Chloroploca asiatica]|uniref:Two-component system response regulator n=1 Tax=Candidatus Chloroploca asiatica TaxID=1506545 RepID=A0A2H3KN39_9CHLR|nr:response regulator [Candidatus Chloroploca asiatica]PDV96546.1 two-component system response regulator [Candidatus Chloroploca asiatica]
MPRLLLVEDNEMNRQMIVGHLKWLGYEVFLAADGHQAVELAADLQPDLILMDMGLPLLNGWDATAQIKADPVLATIPIIALTAYAMSDDYYRSMAAGCDAFETKPIDFEHLAATMERLLAGSR